MGKYYSAGLFLLICIYLLLADNFSKKQGLFISKDSPPWHFSNNPKLHKKSAGLYELEESPNTLFDIDIHDFDIKGGIRLHKGRLCEVFFYNASKLDEKKLDTIVNRFRLSALSKGLNEEYYNYNGRIRYVFSSKHKSGIHMEIIKNSDLDITIININDGCARGEY